MRSIIRRRGARGGLVAIVAAVLCVSLAGTASAQSPDCAGQGVPASKISIQLWTFAEYIGFGTDAATIERTREVFEFLADTGYRNVEPFTLSGLSAEENRILGIKYFGSGGTPNYATEAEWIAYAEYLNELGEQARRAGQTLMVHNHNWEFERVFGDRTAFDILVEHTDPRNVVFQVDLYWATRGLGVEAGVTSVDAADDLTAELLEQLGNRAQLFPVKDMATGTFPGRIEIVGEGGIDFPTLFDATRGPVRYYVVEHDPRFGDPTFDPFEAAATGFEYLDCVTF